jgi:WD40 repeat protein
MRFLGLAALMAATLLGMGAQTVCNARADEIYSRNKYTLCGTPGRPGEIITTATSFTAFSPDGARVAIATEDRIVHICETATGNEIATLTVSSSLSEDDDYLNFVAFSSDGLRIATASNDKRMRVWDIAGSRELAALEHPSPTYFATFSPDGSRLATWAGDGTVRLWDVASGHAVATLEHPSGVAMAVFSPDGTRLVATCADGTVHMWDTASTQRIMVLRGHADGVREAAFNADGKRLVTASDDGTARTWDATNGVSLLILRHASPVWTAAFSEDGGRIVTGAGSDAHVFDAATGREVGVLKGHEYEINDAAFSPDGTRIVSGSVDKSVRVWDAASAEEIARLEGYLSAASFVAFTPDGRRIFSAGGGEGIIWTKLTAGSLPDGVAGLWFTDFGTPEEPLPAEIVKTMCVASPIKINSDGLIVFYEALDNNDPPHPMLHMRCASDLTCQIFPEAPGQGLESQGTGSVSFSENGGDLCLAGECRPIARCPAITWTDDDRNSGFAERWEAAMGAGK